jgi:hypothetical protein
MRKLVLQLFTSFRKVETNFGSTGSIKHESAPLPPLPRWVHTTRVVGNIASDTIDQHHICSGF